MCWSYLQISSSCSISIRDLLLSKTRSLNTWKQQEYHKNTNSLETRYLVLKSHVKLYPVFHKLLFATTTNCLLALGANTSYITLNIRQVGLSFNLGCNSYAKTLPNCIVLLPWKQLVKRRNRKTWSFKCVLTISLTFWLDGKNCEIPAVASTTSLTAGIRVELHFWSLQP